MASTNVDRPQTTDHRLHTVVRFRLIDGATSSVVRGPSPAVGFPHRRGAQFATSVFAQGEQGEEQTVEPRRSLVLVIDDDPNILATIADVLDFEGYEVAKAPNGLLGLEALERLTPALVLLDMRMPVMDGWAFASAVKARGIQVPIVVMTAAQDARKWAAEIGADGYVPKPFHLPDLLSVVERFATPS